MMFPNNDQRFSREKNERRNGKREWNEREYLQRDHFKKRKANSPNFPQPNFVGNREKPFIGRGGNQFFNQRSPQFRNKQSPQFRQNPIEFRRQPPIFFNQFPPNFVFRGRGQNRGRRRGNRGFGRGRPNRRFEERRFNNRRRTSSPQDNRIIHPQKGTRPGRPPPIKIDPHKKVEIKPKSETTQGVKKENLINSNASPVTTATPTPTPTPIEEKDKFKEDNENMSVETVLGIIEKLDHSISSTKTQLKSLEEENTDTTYDIGLEDYSSSVYKKKLCDNFIEGIYFENREKANESLFVFHHLLNDEEYSNSKIDVLKGKNFNEIDIVKETVQKHNKMKGSIEKEIKTKIERRKQVFTQISKKMKGLREHWNKEKLSVNRGRGITARRAKNVLEKSRITPMITYDLRDYKFLSTNGLDDDPLTNQKQQTTIQKSWNDQEINVFYEKFSQYPKDLRRIASFLPNKTTSDVINYYYLIKCNDRFKDLMKNIKRKRRYRQRRIIHEGSTLLRGTRTRRISINPGIQRNLSKSIMTRSNQQQRRYSMVKNTNIQPVPNTTIIPTNLIQPKQQNQIINQGNRITTRSTRSKSTATATILQPDRTHWTENEQRDFIELLKRHGKDFQTISKGVGTKTLAQCRNFFNNNKLKLNLEEHANESVRNKYLNSCIQDEKENYWTRKEKNQFLTFFRKHGRDWNEIAKNFQKKTSTDVKDHFIKTQFELGLISRESMERKQKRNIIWQELLKIKEKDPKIDLQNLAAVCQLIEKNGIEYFSKVMDLDSENKNNLDDQNDNLLFLLNQAIEREDLEEKQKQRNIVINNPNIPKQIPRIEDNGIKKDNDIEMKDKNTESEVENEIVMKEKDDPKVEINILKEKDDVVMKEKNENVGNTKSQQSRMQGSFPVQPKIVKEIKNLLNQKKVNNQQPHQVNKEQKKIQHNNSQTNVGGTSNIQGTEKKNPNPKNTQSKKMRNFYIPVFNQFGYPPPIFFPPQTMFFQPPPPVQPTKYSNKFYPKQNKTNVNQKNNQQEISKIEIKNPIQQKNDAPNKIEPNLKVETNNPDQNSSKEETNVKNQQDLVDKENIKKENSVKKNEIIEISIPIQQDTKEKKTE